MGHEFFLYMQVGDFELTARMPSDQVRSILEAGLNSQVWFRFEMAKCHIFDAESELNISL